MNATTKPLGLFALVALAACASSSPQPVVPAVAPAAAAPAPAAVASATLLSTAQADRGRSVFDVACTACHSSSEFMDASFKRRWGGRTAGDLFDQISRMMPDDAPGSLSPEKYAELVTYILRMNGFEATGAGATLGRAEFGNISLAGISGG